MYYFHTEKGFSQAKAAIRIIEENYLKPVFFLANYAILG
jgi:hypothetical protein